MLALPSVICSNEPVWKSPPGLSSSGGWQLSLIDLPSHIQSDYKSYGLLSGSSSSDVLWRNYEATNLLASSLWVSVLVDLPALMTDFKVSCPCVLVHSRTVHPDIVHFELM
ncbi:hypothetical protein AHF37_08754 [Paragonimus kellicotti]|nr:hypothetical protein AHF37_08754 [Paragonimus kellicotti]